MTEFARETGDLKGLSQTDLKVIALGLQIAKTRGEMDRVAKEPKPLQEFRPKKFLKDYEKEEDWSDSEDE